MLRIEPAGYRGLTGLASRENERAIGHANPACLYSGHFPVIADDTRLRFPRGRAERRGEFAMSSAPLMPKATAVWLVENTALSFDQVADFCKLHPLEVKAIADGDAAQGIKGLDPILTGQLTREEIDQAEADPEFKLKLLRPEGPPARGQAQEGPALHAGLAPPGPAERHPLAGAQPSGAQGQPDHAAGRHHQVDHPGDPRAHPLERAEPAADGPGDARPVLADRPRPRSAPRRQGEAGRRRGAGRRRCCPPPRPPSGRASPEPEEKKPSEELNVDAVFAKLKQIGGGRGLQDG